MASDKEVKQFVSEGLKAEDQKGRIAIVVFLVALLCLLLASANVAHAGGQPTLTVSGTRAILNLSLSQEPASNVLRYYVDGSGELTYTVQWTHNSLDWTTTVSNTRGWAAFKVFSETEGYVSDVLNPFWADDPNDQTGWLQRTVFTPTLTVSGNYSVTLTAWGIWGDESFELWGLGSHVVFTPTWSKVATDTYQITLGNTAQVESLKIDTWPDLVLQADNPYWLAGISPGWVVHKPMPFRLLVPFLAK